MQVLDAGNNRVDWSQPQQIAGSHIPGGHDHIAGVESLNDLLRRHAVGPQTIRVDADHNGSGCSAKGRWCRDAGQSGKQRPHTVERDILDLSHRTRRTGEYEIAYRNTPRVEAQDEWRDRSRRHEGAGAVHVPHRLRRRLAHVGAGLKRQLYQPHVLNGLRFDRLNSRDVKEMIFVVVNEVAFHLCWGHTPEWLRHINHRQVQVGKNVHRHAHDCQD